MVGFKNRYMVMEVFLDPNGSFGGVDPIVITQFNISRAIKDSILLNFGECGLAFSLGSFQVKGTCKYVNPRYVQVRQSHYKIVHRQGLEGGVSESSICHDFDEECWKLPSII